MEMTSGWVAFFDPLELLLLGCLVLGGLIAFVYVFLQYRFLRYLRIERPRDHARLGKPDEITRTKEDGSYFSLDRFVFRQEYLAIPDAQAQRLGKTLRELQFVCGALLLLGVLCVLLLRFE